MNGLEILSCGLDDTNEYAVNIAKVLAPGDVIILEGSLATGKTQFVKMCCEALDYKNLVTSPSYTVANFYSLGDFNIMHVDLYRIDNEYEFLEIGLDNYLEDSITFIEWGDKFQEYFADFMKIKFEFVDDSENCRKLKLTIK